MTARRAIHALVFLVLCACVLAATPRAGAAADPAAPGAPEAAASSGAPVSPKESGAAAAPAPEADSSVSIFPIEGDKPLSIRSDELEALEEAGRRRLLFTGSVHVEQDDLTVRSDRLEAFYPEDASQPEKLVAVGRVRVTERDRLMLCDRATYFRQGERILCVGNAELQQGSDRVRGKEIEIFVRENRVKVRGGAVVNVAGDDAKATAPAAQARQTP